MDQQDTKPIIQTETVLIAEDIELTEEWKKRFKWPNPELVLNTVRAVFAGSSFNCCVKVKGDNDEVKLESGVASAISLTENEYKTFTITLIPSFPVHITSIEANFTPLDPEASAAIPINIDDVRVVLHPEHAMQVMFDFTYAIEACMGSFAQTQKEVEIRNPGGPSCFIRKSSPNFSWRKQKLFCKLPLGEHRMRIRLNHEAHWSEWIFFKVTRRMTL